MADASEADLAYLFDRAYDRYCDQRALIGSPDTCAATVDALRAAGVDEIAALVDFGLPPEEMKAGLEQLDVLRRRYHEPPTQPKRPEQRRAPATPAQRRLWLAATLIANPAAYNEIQGVRLRGPLDVEALRTAVAGLVRRHDGLRTAFVAGGDGVFQVVREDRDRACPALIVDDVRGRDADEVIRATLRRAPAPTTSRRGRCSRPAAAARRRRPRADPRHAPPRHRRPLRGAGRRRPRGVLPGGGGGSRAPLRAGRREHARHDRGDRGERTTWTGGAPTSGTGRARPRCPRTGRAPAPSPDAAVPWGCGSARSGRGGWDWSGRQGVTLFATLLTAWRIVLRQYAGQDDSVIGSTFGRRTPRRGTPSASTCPCCRCAGP